MQVGVSKKKKNESFFSKYLDLVSLFLALYFTSKRCQNNSEKKNVQTFSEKDFRKIRKANNCGFIEYSLRNFFNGNKKNRIFLFIFMSEKF